MDYFSVIVLILITFVFASDRSIKSIEQIGSENVDIYPKISDIKNKIEILTLNESEMNYNSITKRTNNCNKEYILIQNKKLHLTENNIDEFIANYIISNMNPCGFNLVYVYNEERGSFKGIYLDIINYLNIFNKKQLSTYGIIICKKQDLSKGKKYFQSKITSYTSNKNTYILLKDNEIKKSKLKKIYIRKISRANLDIIFKLFLLIFSGSIITTNLIYAIIDANNSVSGLIIPIIIYYCYSYIIRYIYKPIGKKRIIATYIFPIYFISYLVITISTLASKVIKKVQVS